MRRRAPPAPRGPRRSARAATASPTTTCRSPPADAGAAGVDTFQQVGGSTATALLSGIFADSVAGGLVGRHCVRRERAPAVDPIPAPSTAHGPDAR